MPADPDRQRVYAAEEALRDLLDQVSSAPGQPVSVVVGRSRVVLPPEARFGDIPSVQRYCEQVMDLDRIAARWPTRPVAVRLRKGTAKAHWESTGTIAIPDEKWAMRETVVLHELAHHLTPGYLAHGKKFQDALMDLYETVMSPEVAFVARVLISS